MSPTIKRPDLPATKAQLWALYNLSKEDHRYMDLTVLQANNLIKEYINKKNQTKEISFEDKLYNYLISNRKEIDEIVKYCIKYGFNKDYSGILSDAHKKFINTLMWDNLSSSETIRLNKIMNISEVFKKDSKINYAIYNLITEFKNTQNECNSADI